MQGIAFNNPSKIEYQCLRHASLNIYLQYCLLVLSLSISAFETRVSLTRGWPVLRLCLFKATKVALNAPAWRDVVFVFYFLSPLHHTGASVEPLCFTQCVVSVSPLSLGVSLLVSGWLKPRL